MMFYLNARLATAVTLHILLFSPDCPVNALPVTSKGGATFTVDQVFNPHYNSSGLNGPAALSYSFNKFGTTLETSILAAGAQGSVPATPYPSTYDREYLSTVSIGTPAQTLPLNFDTGSSDLWVFSTNTVSTSVSGQVLYNILKSTTAKLLAGQTWTITYGDGSACAGTVYADTVTIGGITFASQAVESANTVSASFTSVAASSGLLGLASSSINTVRPNPQKTWFENVQSTLAAPIFTANLRKGAVGSYGFGYIDASLYTGAIAYTPTINPGRGLWEFSASGYQIGNVASQPFVTQALDLIADTGSSMMLLPNAIVQAYWATVNGATYSSTYGAYIFPCANIANLPDFFLGVGTFRAQIPGGYLSYGQVSTTMCYGGLQSQGTLPFGILGDVALKALFVVFDNGSAAGGGVRRLGFANKNRP